MALSICEENMVKDSSVMKAVCDYAEVSTVHGISYVFSRSLPQVDRLLWTILTTIGYLTSHTGKMMSSNSDGGSLNKSFNSH